VPAKDGRGGRRPWRRRGLAGQPGAFRRAALLVQKAHLMHQPFGQGHVAFAEDASYRGVTEATMLLFMNAVLLGPGY
jgi:hypothetical protein